MDKRAWPTGIRPNGKGIQIRIFRNRQCVYSETVPGDPYKPRDIAAAVRRRRHLESRLEMGLPLYEGDESSATSLTAAAQDYLNDLDGKDSTSIGYENILNKYWLPHIGHWPIHEVTGSKIKEILNAIRPSDSRKKDLPPDKEISRKTKRNILGPLRKVFEHAGVVPNPAVGIKIKAGQKPKVERYTPKQRDALLAALTGQTQVYFAVLFGCGLRPCGEPLALQWPDYDGEQLEICKQITRRKHVPSTKTSVRRSVYVPTWVRSMLNNHYTRFDGGHIFQNTQGGPYLDTDKFNDEWRKAHKKCRIPYRDPYKCRHTRAAELLSIGIEPADAAKQLGHSLEMFLRTYAEFIEEFSKNKDKSRFEGVKPTALSVG